MARATPTQSQNHCTIAQASSIIGAVATSITFVNATSGSVDVYWLDYQGGRVYYYTLAPGQSYVQSTWVTHPWVAIDRASGVCVGFTIAVASAFTYTIDGDLSQSPAAPGPPPANACTPTGGGVGTRLLGSMKCAATQTVLEAKCAFGVAGLIAVPLKALKVPKAASGLYDLSKLDPSVRPIAKVINTIKSSKFLPGAPKGYRTAGDVTDKLMKAKKATDVVKILPSLAKAVSKADFSAIALALDDVLGLRPCVQAVANALE
jgi:hypothetical protein